MTFIIHLLSFSAHTHNMRVVHMHQKNPSSTTFEAETSTQCPNILAIEDNFIGMMKIVVIDPQIYERVPKSMTFKVLQIFLAWVIISFTPISLLFRHTQTLNGADFHIQLCTCKFVVLTHRRFVHQEKEVKFSCALDYMGYS